MAPNYICELCAKHFPKSFNLKRHYTNMHSGHTPVNKVITTSSVKCAICGSVQYSVQEFDDHVKSEHSITLDKEDFQFNNLDEFRNWKKSVEINCYFIKYTAGKVVNDGNALMTYYKCNRSGYSKGPSNRKRRPKSQGSLKIDAYCPARIKAKLNRDGKVDVMFCRTHVGHDLERGKIPLPIDETKSFDKVQGTVKNGLHGKGLSKKHEIQDKCLGVEAEKATDLEHQSSSGEVLLNVTKQGNIEDEIGTHFILSAVEKQQMESDFRKKKQNLMESISEMIKKVQTIEQLDLVKNMLQVLEPQLDAATRDKGF